ncbi:hypothetical protein C9J03_01180 [Photobacterium gaetbulicola]|nr:hypothetical protein [Photobacterium gaetbulicola]PSU14718.1 hypothetical protein C9J03_01180 [Photobacterium gaetbulicola]
MAISVPISLTAEPLLMGFDEYMERCTLSYGEDKIARSVCENQYKAIEQKEQEIFAHTNELTNEIWLDEKNNSESLSEQNEQVD